MARYIEVDALEPDTEWDGYYDGFISYSQTQIDCAPLIEIVRCKDCRRFYNNFPWCICKRTNMPTEGYDFCSRGEVKDNE